MCLYRTERGVENGLECPGNHRKDNREKLLTWETGQNHFTELETLINRRHHRAAESKWSEGVGQHLENDNEQKKTEKSQKEK